MSPFQYCRRSGPLLVSMPHVGTDIPDDIAAGMTEAGRAMPDTDWYVDRLYDFLDELGASTIASTHSRYVIDLNRPPDDENLYPGQDTPGLVPIDTFDHQPIYQAGAEPDADEIARRLERYWRPYHEKLRSTLDELVEEHGVAFLFEAHSIRSEVPRLWRGRLPDLNLGTGDGSSCAAGIAAAMLEAAEDSADYTAVLNGRFKGGYITRRYGEPARNIHAVQLELSQRTYMTEDGAFELQADLADQVRPVLRRLVEVFVGSGLVGGR